MKLTQLQKEVLVGTLLGDGSLQWNQNKTTCRFRFVQKNYDYCYHVYEVFQNFVTTPPKQNRKTKVWYFNTTQHACFRFYAQQFYSGKDKVVPRLIHRWLTPKVIAYWYMDDGSAKDQKKSSGCRFCTDNFKLKDVKRLETALSTLCSTQTSTFKQRNNYRIYISGKKQNGWLFGQKILPYIQPEMNYKVPIRWLKEYKPSYS